MSVIRRDDNLETVRARRAITAKVAARLFAPSATADGIQHDLEKRCPKCGQDYSLHRGDEVETVCPPSSPGARVTQAHEEATNPAPREYRYSRPYNLFDETGPYFDITPQCLEQFLRNGAVIHSEIVEGIPEDLHIIGVKAMNTLDPNVREGECGQFIRFFLGRKDGATPAYRGAIHITVATINPDTKPQ